MDYKAKVKVHAVNNGEHTKGWIHTHGMVEYDLPELEMRNVPLFLVPDAYRMLREICDYMLSSEKPVLAGHTMEMGNVCFQFVTPVPIPGEDEHYREPRLQVAEYVPLCESCAGSE